MDSDYLTTYEYYWCSFSSNWPVMMVTDRGWLSRQLLTELNKVVEVSWHYETDDSVNNTCLRFRNRADAAIACILISDTVFPEGQIQILQIIEDRQYE